MLEYKAARYGRTLVKVGRFEPTSQVCSVCGVRDGPKSLGVREWACRACGAVLDRDVNAAVNVARAAGLAASACGAQVRPEPVPAPRHEAGTRPEPPAQADRPVREQIRDGGTKLTDAGSWTVVARLTGPVLLALAVLAVRNRVKR